jgi:hypothetical protein
MEIQMYRGCLRRERRKPAISNLSQRNHHIPTDYPTFEKKAGILVLTFWKVEFHHPLRWWGCERRVAEVTVKSTKGSRRQMSAADLQSICPQLLASLFDWRASATNCSLFRDFALETRLYELMLLITRRVSEGPSCSSRPECDRNDSPGFWRTRCTSLRRVPLAIERLESAYCKSRNHRRGRP